MRENEELMEQARAVAKESLTACLAQGGQLDWSNLKAKLRDDLREFLYQRTKRSPMILPVVMEI